ncbi:leucine zipper protein 2-like [Discoglossus pictus]
MSSIPACTLLCLLPVLALSTKKNYGDLEKQLKDVFMERRSFLHQFSKISRELEGIKDNLQTLKSNEASIKTDVKKLLELEEKQREEMRMLQEAFTKQLNEATEKAEKQQATVSFLKAEMERKNKIIRDLQNENKSLKNKLMSGNKLCGLRAEESKRIQAQLKELRYGKKDLISKARQLTDLEQKLSVAKDEMEKASLDQESQLKALKETAQLCLSSVLHNMPSTINIIPSQPRESSTSLDMNISRVPSQSINKENQSNSNSSKEFHMSEQAIKEYQHDKNCDTQNAGKACRLHHNNSTALTKRKELEPSIQQLHGPPWIKPEYKHLSEHRKNVNIT